MLHASTYLPPTDTKRWVPRRKAAVVAAVRSGAISLEEACRLYHLSEEEFRGWESRFTERPTANYRDGATLKRVRPRY